MMAGRQARMSYTYFYSEFDHPDVDVDETSVDDSMSTDDDVPTEDEDIIVDEDG